MHSSTAVILIAALAAVSNAASVSATCPPPGLAAVKDLNIEKYISAPWYIQWQAETSYQKKDSNYCVRAIYTKTSGWAPSHWFSHNWFFGPILGFFRSEAGQIDINVFNYANKNGVNGQQMVGNLSAVVLRPETFPGELLVGPGFIPRVFWGPYWVVAIGDQYDWAIISGGPPNRPTSNGKCETGDGINNSGFWFFTRDQNVSADLINKMLGVATDLGYDTGVLNKVEQKGCEYLLQ